ncbi:nicotinate-nucleotide adenylyltransferase [Chloroflexota bacterium]
MKKRGVLGGTFDPVHNGHLGIARYVRESLALDEVVFIPAGHPYLKGDTAITQAEHRIAMLRLALEGLPGFCVSDMEFQRPGPTFTLDTMLEMKNSHPEEEIYFILGWDNLQALPRWYRPQELIRVCRLVALPRPGTPRPDTAAIEKAVPGIGSRLCLLSAPEIDVSASDIRSKVARGQDITALVPPTVATYIRTHCLYNLE